MAGLLVGGAAHAEPSFDVEAGQWRAEPDASRAFGDFVSLLKESPEEHDLKREHPESWDTLWQPEALYIDRDGVEPYGMAHPSVKEALEEIFGPGYALPETVLHMPLGIDVRARPPVVAFVNFWTGPARSTMTYYLARMGRYESLIREIFREEGVPEDMIYLCLIESGFSPRAHSLANAGGMWQFIPATAVNYGLRIDGEVDERRDPVKATRAAARLLRNLYEKLGSWPLAMAGYNAGSGHVIRAMNKANSDNYWAIARRNGLYEKTRDYVAKILAAGLIGTNREAFGFGAVVPREPVAFEVVQIPGGTSLSAVADSIGVGVDVLRALNPELLAARAPGRAGLYPLNIPAGKTQAFVREFDQVAARGGNQGYVYTLRIGETMAQAARRLGLPEQILRTTSGFSPKERVPYGTRLVISREVLESRSPQLLPSSGQSIDDVLRGRGERDGGRLTALLPSTRFEYPDRARVFYRTIRGDDLRELGRHFEVHPSLIAMWNDLETDAELKAGLVLQLYLPRDADLNAAVVYHDDQVRCVYDGTAAYLKEAARKRNRPAGTGSGGGRSYKVSETDTIDTIAAKFGVTSAQLLTWNNLKGRSLKPGYRLVIYGSGGPGRRPDEATAAVSPPPRRARRSRSSREPAAQESARRDPPRRERAESRRAPSRKSRARKVRRRAAPRRPVRRTGNVRHQMH